ncbi:MAG: hypothetical protein M5U26_18480 [Planctomycetota bacterium]|nr:hypothetical protein [Planctomycetota bacterium]
MNVSLYLHAWQAFLMFLSGLVCVLAGFVGYLRTGGAEATLQQALVTFLPQDGKATFRRPIDLDLRRSVLTVHGLRHSGLHEGGDSATGLYAERCEFHLDLWPWPPRVQEVHVVGMPELKVQVESGFLQRPRAPVHGPKIPIHFDGIDLEARIGDLPPLKLRGCSGRLERGKERELIGEFQTREFNGQPFRIRLASLGDGRWDCAGAEIQIDTQAQLKDPSAGPEDEGRIDPVVLLIRNLLSGDAGAKGALPSLHVEVQLPSATRPFSCEGHVSYRDLELRLPREVSQEVPLPRALNWMQGGKGALWPAWLRMDSLRTGPEGRISFHMVGGRLEFNIDEGPGSAITARRDGQNLLPVESLKGSIVTDEENRASSIVLRGFLGSQLQGEVRMRREPDGGRGFELVFEPRAAGAAREARTPLWRFSSLVDDYSALDEALRGDRPLVRFEVELTSQDFPEPFLLPPGVRDLKGRLSVKGRYLPDRVLFLDRIGWENGGLVFGGAERHPHPLRDQAYGPFLVGLRTLWGGEEAWRLQDVNLTAAARVSYDESFEWVGTEILKGSLASGLVSYRDRTTNLGPAKLEVIGRYQRHADAAREPQIHFVAGARDPETGQFAWSMQVLGTLLDSRDGELRFLERNVPADFHPEWYFIDGKYKSGIFDRRVNRETILRLKDGQVEKARP